MYEFIINGLAVTREEFFQEIDTKSARVFDESKDNLSEVFETGSITIDSTVFQISEVRP